jgi:CRP-like cAMP-binding protein
LVSLAKARSVLTSVGWLSKQPEAFQAEVLRRTELIHFAPGDVIYRLGDTLGGVYGLVEGAVAVTTSPPVAVPRLFHVGAPGSWIGEGCFLSREPRRVGMQAAVDTWMMHLPLEAMDQMEKHDPSVVRRFNKILLINLDILVRAFYDLHKPDPFCRVASALRRISLVDGTQIPLSQTELGLISNTSRKQVNAALQKFEAAGWLKKGYRSITITSLGDLSQFADRGAQIRQGNVSGV